MIAPEPHDLRGAAADIEQDDAFGLRVHQRRAADGGELGFGLAIDDFEVEADLALHAVAEFHAVLGRAAGFGRDQPRAR